MKKGVGVTTGSQQSNNKKTGHNFFLIFSILQTNFLPFLHLLIFQTPII